MSRQRRGATRVEFNAGYDFAGHSSDSFVKLKWMRFTCSQSEARFLINGLVVARGTLIQVGEAVNAN